MTGVRNLVLILLLANLGVWAVFAWVADEPSPSPVYQGTGITLLRELDPAAPITRAAAPPATAPVTDGGAADIDPAAAAGAESLPDDLPAGETPFASEPATVSGTAFGRCVSIGPFPTETAADSAFETLTEAGFEPLRAVRESEVWDGYWVYIGQVGNLAAARTVQAELAGIGLGDTQIVSTAGSGNLLSLGVFSEITRAGAQAERVNRIGYEAIIADNLSTAETQWLDVTLTSEQSLALDMLQAPGQISRLEMQNCAPAEGN
jgi:hypothetical protein